MKEAEDRQREIDEAKEAFHKKEKAEADDAAAM